jgi:redox-regulated HSP33 family molecular chaperone
MAFTALNAEDQTRLDKVVDDGAILIDDDISFGNGTIAVTVKNSTNTDYTGWVMITATGTLAEYNVSRTRTMYFDPENQNDMVWKEN